MEIQVDFSGGACILAALLCLVLPLDWVAAAALAAIFHELCHFLAVCAAGGKVQCLTIGMTGARMDAAPMPPWKELMCILAGPTGSLSLILVASVFHRVALCGMVQGIFNLLPVSPLDGGRALSCGAEMLFSPAAANRICSTVKWITLVMILLAGLWGSLVLKLGFMPLIISLLLILRSSDGKIPCIAEDMGVQ